MREETRSRIATGLDRVGLLGPLACAREGWLSTVVPRTAGMGPDGFPVPPPRLRLLVDGRNADSLHYWSIGRQMSAAIAAAADAAGSPIEEMEAILDFGCGCGRVARHWADLRGPEFHACDYNPDLVGWCGRNLPFLRPVRNGLAPPLPYVSGSFDLIYALSVLSHLGEPLQRAWIAEFGRLLRPGGLLVVTVLGEAVSHRLPSEERKRFHDGALVVERSGMAGRNLCTAYHPREYVTEQLLSGFEDVAGFELGSPALVLLQDAYIGRRPAALGDTRSS